MRISYLVVAATGLALAACTPPAATPEPSATAQSAAAALTPAGEASSVSPMAPEQNLEWAASVVRVDTLQNQGNGGGKLFGLAGGDPAMNGLYTHLAFYQSPADGWRVFRIGDFLDYRVLSDVPGRVDLEINESTLNSESGEIGSQTRHVIVAWTPGAEGEPPSTITVTPASAQ